MLSVKDLKLATVNERDLNLVGLHQSLFCIIRFKSLSVQARYTIKFDINDDDY